MEKRGNGTNGKAKYNPTITAFFDAPKFAIRDGEGNTIEGSAFLSAAIDAKGFEALQKYVQLGSRLLLRRTKNPEKNNYFLEVLPPLSDKTTTNATTNGNGRRGKAAANTIEDEI